MPQMRKYSTTSLLMAVCLFTAGCHHKVVALPPVAQAQVQVPLVSPPEPPMIQKQPLPTAPTIAMKPPRKPRKKVAAKPVAPPPVQVAAVEAPPQNVIGALTAGGDSSPEKRQQANDMIATVERRLKAIAADIQEHRRTQVVEVRTFLSKAQVAFGGGDLDGALGLATKAKLLLDDLEK